MLAADSVEEFIHLQADTFAGPLATKISVLEQSVNMLFNEVDRLDAQVKAKGKGDLEKLFKNDDLWTVE